MTMPRMRSFLSRRRGAVSLTIVAALLLACSTNSPSQPDVTSAADQPTPTGTATTVSPATSTATSSAPVFTVDGTPPYTLGASLAGLDAGNKVTQVQPSTEVCIGNTTARGTGAFGDIRLSFRDDGKLYLVTNRGTSIPTASGARVGTTTYNELKSMYASMAHEELAQGDRKFYLVKAGSGRGILFDIDSATGKVFTMSAADATFLHDSVVNGTDFC